MNSDRYLPSEDAPKQDILISLKELGAKRIPGAPMYARAAQEIEQLREAVQTQNGVVLSALKSRQKAERQLAVAREAIAGVIRVADRKTIEFDAARAALTDDK